MKPFDWDAHVLCRSSAQWHRETKQQAGVQVCSDDRAAMAAEGKHLEAMVVQLSRQLELTWNEALDAAVERLRQGLTDPEHAAILMVRSLRRP